PYRLLPRGLATDDRAASRCTGGNRHARPAPLLRVTAHPPRRVREDGAAPTRPRHGGRDPRHLLAPVARLRRPDAGGRGRDLDGCAPGVPREQERIAFPLLTGAGRTSWSVSRILSPGALRRHRWATIHLGPPSPTGSSGLPAGIGRATLKRLRSSRGREPFGLAPGGVYRATPVTRGAGGLLHHRFTLTPRGVREAVCFL